MSEEESLEMIKTEESENLSIVVSENGRRSYRFTAPLLEGYTLGRDPYREFRKGINIITYQDDSLSTVNATLEANYAIYYENRKLWEAKGNVRVTKADGTKLYTQQLFWNSITKRIYSNVDTKVETDTDTFIGEGFESDEELNELRFRRLKGKMLVDTNELINDDSVSTDRKERPAAAGPAPDGGERVNGSGKLAGVLTDGDIRRTLIKYPDTVSLLVKDVMTVNPKRISGEEYAASALHLMEKYSITALAVVDSSDKPIGVIHIHDILKAGVA